MKEKEVAFALINRIGLENLKNKEVLESLKATLCRYEDQSQNFQASSSDPPFKNDAESLKTPEKKEFSKNEYQNYKPELSNEQKPVEVQVLDHLASLRTHTRRSNQDSSHYNDPKCKSLLKKGKNLLVEFKRKSSWYSILDEDLENEKEGALEGVDRLLGLVLCLLRLERYSGSEPSVVLLLVNNVIFSFRYTFQSEKSNLSLVHHPEWAMEYMTKCAKKYVSVFKNFKNELKLETTKYFQALVPRNYAGDAKLLEEFTLVCRETNVDEIVADWCLALAKEARLFAYSRLPFLVYEYFGENEENPLRLVDLTKIISEPKSSTVLEVSRSTFTNDKVTSAIYALLNSMVEFGLYLKGLSEGATFELFSDFDNNTVVPYIMIQFYTNRKQDFENQGEMSNESEAKTDNEEDKNDNEENNDLTTSKEGEEEEEVETKIELCFESKILYGCMEALMEMESVQTMKIARKVISLESFSESIGVKTGLNISMYLQDDQFFCQVPNVLISVLNMVETRCRCLKLVESKRKYVNQVVVPVLEYYVESIKQIWNSLESVLQSLTISCLLLESTTGLHEFMLNYPLSEHMAETVTSILDITHKMVSIFEQYFEELYYEPLKSIHRQPLEIFEQITNKLLEMCALCSYKNYKNILAKTLEELERRVMMKVIPNKSVDCTFEDEEEVEMTLLNCVNLLKCVKKLVDPKDYPETMQQLQDAITILNMETVELKTAAEYLNLLGTTRISGKNHNTEKKDQDSRNDQKVGDPSSGSFLSSVIFDDFEGEQTEDIHDSLIVSKIKQKLRIKKLTLSQTYTLIIHILSATGSGQFPLDEGNSLN